MKMLVKILLLVVLLGKFCTGIHTITPFEESHVAPAPRQGDTDYCRREMNNRGLSHKSVNTFLHSSFQRIKNSCNGIQTRHEVTARYNVTICRKNGQGPYTSTTIPDHPVTIICENRNPVHLRGE